MLLPPFESDTGRRPLNGRPGVRPVGARPPRPADGRPPRPENRTSRPSDDDVVRARPLVPPVPSGPRTTMAPFQAVAAPEQQPDKYSPERLAAGRPRRESQPDEGELEMEGSSSSSTSPGKRSPRPPVPPRERAERPQPDDERHAPWTTGPDAAIGRATPPPPPSANYGDWTKPSRDQDRRRPAAPVLPESEELAAPVGLRPARAPETSMIPERQANRRGAHPESEELEAAQPPAEKTPSRSAGSASPKVVGNRAALRAQRQAADAERRKVVRQTGEHDAVGASKGGHGNGRRLAMALVAVAVVALGVLGVYSFTSPHTKVAAHTAAANPSSSPSNVAAPTQTLPPLVTNAQPAQGAPAAPVKVPITVLNATSVNGLAAKISGAFGGGGWQTTGVGAYKAGDVAATTVFFTQGDETQRQAAVQLVTQFPQLSGPVPRFFDVPNTPNPGLIVVAAGEWRP